MLVLTLSMVSALGRAGDRVIGTMEICNDGKLYKKTQGARSSYKIRMKKVNANGKECSVTAKVLDFERKLGAWDLAFEALKAVSSSDKTEKPKLKKRTAGKRAEVPHIRCLPVNTGGLMRCCLDTLDTTRITEREGDVLQCKYTDSKDHSMVVHNGCWQWNQSSETKKQGGRR